MPGFLPNHGANHTVPPPHHRTTARPHTTVPVRLTSRKSCAERDEERGSTCRPSEDRRMATDLHNWDPLSPDKVRDLFAGLAVPWWIAGGWAIDLFVGRQTRKHHDTDVLVLRDDQLAVQGHLAEWDLQKAEPPGILGPWAKGEFLRPGVHDIWCRRSPQSPWSLQLMLMDTDGDRWVFRRDPSITGPLAAPDGLQRFAGSKAGAPARGPVCSAGFSPSVETLRPEGRTPNEEKPRIAEAHLGRRTDSGIPYLAPEIQILYKAKAETLAKDDADFEVALPMLGAEARRWLLACIERRFPGGHRWVERLTGSRQEQRAERDEEGQGDRRRM